MASFPRTETAVVSLAGNVVEGLAKYSGTYPSPPVPPDELRAALDSYDSARAAAIAAAEAARDQYALKAEALKHLTALVRSDIRYAENRVSYDDEQLKLIGWAGPRPKTKLEAPGQVRGLEIQKEGPGWIILAWEKPLDGGKVAAYRLQSRRPGGDWREAGMEVGSEISLDGQERGVELEYHVIAVNKVGKGEESNLVMAVL